MDLRYINNFFISEGDDLSYVEFKPAWFPSNYGTDANITNIVNSDDKLYLTLELSQADKQSLKNLGSGFFNQKLYQNIWSDGKYEFCFDKLKKSSNSKQERLDKSSNAFLHQYQLCTDDDTIFKQLDSSR